MPIGTLSAVGALIAAMGSTAIGTWRSKYSHDDGFDLDAAISGIDEMTGQEFESLFARILRVSGYSDVRITSATRDGGIDVTGTHPDGRQVAFQCKRQMAKVGITVIRLLLGSMRGEYIDMIPCIVTTSELTKPAFEYAQNEGVRIIDRPVLINWLEAFVS